MITISEYDFERMAPVCCSQPRLRCREVAIASMGQSGGSWNLLVCYSHQNSGGTAVGECKLVYGDGTSSPIVYSAGPSESQFVFSSSNTAAISVSTFNSTAGIVCYSTGLIMNSRRSSYNYDCATCALLTRDGTTLSRNTALTHWPNQLANDVRSSSVRTFSDGANGNLKSVVCFERYDAGNVSCYPVSRPNSDWWGTDLVSGEPVPVPLPLSLPVCLFVHIPCSACYLPAYLSV